MTVQEEKKALRALFRQQAAGFEAAYLRAADGASTEKLLALPEYRNAGTVFCYVSVRGEPDTRALMADALAAGKRLCVPRCLGGGVMEARQIAGEDELRAAPFGLLEPGAEAPLVAPKTIDLVVAPCIAVDRLGNRLGYGAGYYDNYLAQLRCPVVCLCRGRLVQPLLPQESFDVPMDMVLTEEELIVTGEGGGRHADV